MWYLRERSREVSFSTLEEDRLVDMGSHRGGDSSNLLLETSWLNYDISQASGRFNFTDTFWAPKGGLKQLRGHWKRDRWRLLVYLGHNLA
jgi:hypothetical protein